MNSTGILGLVSRSNNWLSGRQALISQNIANANTPGYRAQDLQSFQKALEMAGASSIAKTHGAHLDVGGPLAAMTEPVETEVDEAGMHHSGNSVSLDSEMLKAGQVLSGFALGTSVYKSFHRMLITGSR